MNEVKFRVQGSAPEPYEVTFKKTEKNLTAHCTCQAGQVGQYCKHRLAILRGETTGIVSTNQSDVAVIKSWLPGTDVEAALQEFEEAERALEEAKARSSHSKKKLARSLMN